MFKMQGGTNRGMGRMSNDTMPDKLFLTSWPGGTLIPVKTLGKHPSIKGGIYIWYLGGRRPGGTDTTTDEFLFDLPDADTVPRDKVEALIAKIGNSGGRACPMCYAIGGKANEYHDEDCVNGQAIAALEAK